MLDDRNLVVADIRDADRIAEVFAEHRPQVVFHAAALKHLPLLEMHPAEAVKTNVPGHPEPARRGRSPHDVEPASSTSRPTRPPTPRACWATSKRVAERLTAAAAARGRRHLRQRAVRQRAGQPGLGPHRLPGPDRGRRPGHRHRPRRHPLLHDRRGGRAAGDPGRRHRRRRRGPRPRHGRAGPHRRRRPPHGRAGRRSGPDRLHRAAPGREAARGAGRRGRGPPGHRPPADLLGRRPARHRRGAGRPGAGVGAVHHPGPAARVPTARPARRRRRPGPRRRPPGRRPLAVADSLTAVAAVPVAGA